MLHSKQVNNLMKEITATELKSMMDSGKELMIIDIREPYEYQIANIGAKSVPLVQLLDYAEKLPRDREIIFHCKSGNRSTNAIKELERRFGFDNLVNLKGGLQAWSEEVDPTMDLI